MKTIISALPALLFFLLIACNNNAENDKSPDASSPKATADSLEKEVTEVHNIVMPKSMKIPDIRKEISRMMDSIKKLAPKEREAAASYLSKLNTLDKDLANAYDSMENWMVRFGNKLQDFYNDSLKISAEEKIQYYSQEKINVDKIKVAVLENVRKADSLLKAKF